MAKYLTDRQDRKLADIVRKVEGLTGRNNRGPKPELFGAPGTDFGVAIVPRTDIPAATRTAQAGSDDFEPGLGTAWLFKIDDATGLITPWLDNGGAVIFKDVYNFSSKACPSNDAGETDYIGAKTCVLMAIMDRNGKLCIPSDEQGGLFDVSADNGSTVTIDPGDTLDFDASDGNYTTERNDTQSLRGIVNIVEVDGGDPTIKHVRGAIDKSPLQNIVLVGSESSGGPVLVRDGTRNSIELEASTTSPVSLTGTSGKVAFGANDPFHQIDVDGTGGPVDLDFGDTLELTATGGTFNVTKAATTVTVNFVGSGGEVSPIGTVRESVLQPIQDGSFFYIDDGGVADTDWALMDGDSNAIGEGGSGILAATASGTEEEYFVRAKSGTSGDATDTAFGRDPLAVSADPDEDEVEIEVTVGAHPDHIHQFNTDACHDDVTPSTTHFDFSTSTTKNTTVQKKASSTIGDPLTLDHNVTVTLTNNQGSTSAHVELTPPHKKWYFFERVAIT